MPSLGSEVRASADAGGLSPWLAHGHDALLLSGTGHPDVLCGQLVDDLDGELFSPDSTGYEA
jgi:hypothetical protein